VSAIDDKIAAIKSRIDAARTAQIRAEATRESAQVTEAQAMALLAEEFGVDNLAMTRAKLAELQEELQACLDSITSELDEIKF
jgi:hypothetical protein